jgi:hypothetical protein
MTCGAHLIEYGSWMRRSSSWGVWPMPPIAPAAPETFTLTPPTIQVNKLSGNFQVTNRIMTTEFAWLERKGNTERA